MISCQVEFLPLYSLHEKSIRYLTWFNLYPLEKIDLDFLSQSQATRQMIKWKDSWKSWITGQLNARGEYNKICNLFTGYIYRLKLVYQGRPMNISKAILIVIFVMFLILVFFALTGIDLSNPEQAAITMVDKIAQLNRSINRMVRELIFNIRTSFQERFSR